MDGRNCHPFLMSKSSRKMPPQSPPAETGPHSTKPNEDKGLIDRRTIVTSIILAVLGLVGTGILACYGCLRNQLFIYPRRRFEIADEIRFRIKRAEKQLPNDPTAAQNALDG